MRVIDGMRAEPVKPVLAKPFDDLSVQRPESCEVRGVHPAKVMDAEMRGVSDMPVKKSQYQPVRKALERPVSYGRRPESGGACGVHPAEARDAETVEGKEESVECRLADRKMTLGELFYHSMKPEM